MLAKDLDLTHELRMAMTSSLTLGALGLNHKLNSLNSEQYVIYKCIFYLQWLSVYECMHHIYIYALFVQNIIHLYVLDNAYYTRIYDLGSVCCWQTALPEAHSSYESIWIPQKI